MGAKILLNGTSKVNRQTHKQTDTQTYGHFDLYKASAQRADALKRQSKNSTTTNLDNSRVAIMTKKIVFQRLNLLKKKCLEQGFGICLVLGTKAHCDCKSA